MAAMAWGAMLFDNSCVAILVACRDGQTPLSNRCCKSSVQKPGKNDRPKERESEAAANNDGLRYRITPETTCR